jgi:hypothetical protein
MNAGSDAREHGTGLGSVLEHDPEKACPDSIRGEHRLSEKIMLKQQAKAKCRSNLKSLRF